MKRPGTPNSRYRLRRQRFDSARGVERAEWWRGQSQVLGAENYGSLRRYDTELERHLSHETLDLWSVREEWIELLQRRRQASTRLVGMVLEACLHTEEPVAYNGKVDVLLVQRRHREPPLLYAAKVALGQQDVHSLRQPDRVWMTAHVMPDAPRHGAIMNVRKEPIIRSPQHDIVTPLDPHWPVDEAATGDDYAGQLEAAARMMPLIRQATVLYETATEIAGPFVIPDGQIVPLLNPTIGLPE